MKVIENKNYWFILSGSLVLVSLILLFVFGLNLGIDFTGGSLLEMQMNNGQLTHDNIRQVFYELGIDAVQIQSGDNNSAIMRFQDVSEDTHQAILSTLELTRDDISIEEVRFESIGPSIGSELTNRSIRAMIYVLIAIVLYIAWAFRKVSRPVASWKYGLTALVALFHDVLIVVGVFVILGKVFGTQVNTPFIAALLTVLGYSVNDTIVVFDKVRENILLNPRDFMEVINNSVRQTLSRSINTSLTTLLVLGAIFFFGGATIKSFVLALMIGIVVGTYSSLFLASPLLYVWYKLKY